MCIRLHLAEIIIIFKPIKQQWKHEEISVVENGALAEPTLVTQANVINITDVMAEEPEATIHEECVIIIIYKDAQFVMPL